MAAAGEGRNGSGGWHGVEMAGGGGGGAAEMATGGGGEAAAEWRNWRRGSTLADLVFQGVVLTSVAQGSMLRCHNWWLPFALSCIAAFAIIVAVIHMLLKLARCKSELESNRATADHLSRLLLRHKLYRPASSLSGASSSADILYFDAEDLPPSLPLPLSRRIYRLIYPTLALLILLTFTAFVLVACRRILCFPGSLPQGDPSPPGPR